MSEMTRTTGMESQRGGEPAERELDPSETRERGGRRRQWPALGAATALGLAAGFAAGRSAARRHRRGAAFAPPMPSGEAAPAEVAAPPRQVTIAVAPSRRRRLAQFAGAFVTRLAAKLAALAAANLMARARSAGSHRGGRGDSGDATAEERG